MVAVSPATKPARRSGQPAPGRAPANKKQPLRLVRSAERVRSVGAMGTVFALFVFTTLFALAALHAVLVQTQARIDAINRENSALEDQLDSRIAEEAWLDSPAGLREAAISAGLVEATDVVALVPVGEGLLDPPDSGDPFRRGVTG